MIGFAAFACCVVLASAQSCGVSRVNLPDKLIVGGVEATPGAWPWMVSLQKSDYHICGGTVIDSTTVITAAHCVSGSRARQFRVVVGEHDRTTSEGTEFSARVSKIKSHEAYSSRTMSNDIAILFLRDALPMSDRVQPVCLPDSNAGDFDGELATITGWGETENSMQKNTLLRQVSVPVMKNSVCNQAYPGEIDDTMICAGLPQGGKDSCQGDSGGPMVVQISNRWHLAGVVSWGYGCADAGNPGVYARVTQLRSWINKERSTYHKAQLQKIGENIGCKNGRNCNKTNNGKGNGKGKN